jgi:hypothetical protein
MKKAAGGLSPAAFCRFRNTLPLLIDDFSTPDRLHYATFTPVGPGLV